MELEDIRTPLDFPTFSVLNKRLIDMDRKFELQEKQNKEIRDLLTVIFDRLNAVEGKAGIPDPVLTERIDSIEQNVRHIREEFVNVSPRVNQDNTQGSNAAYESEQSDDAYVHTVSPALAFEGTYSLQIIERIRKLLTFYFHFDRIGFWNFCTAIRQRFIALLESKIHKPST